MAESLCVLYVAVTRAVHVLHMIVAPSADNERTLHKTFGGLLRAALTDGSRLGPEQIAYETGDRAWFRKPGVEHEPSAGEVAIHAESLAPLEVKVAAPAERRWRGLQRVSPSGLEGGTHVRLADQGSDSDSDRTAALSRGTLIHAWFEQIEWLDEGAPGDDHLRASQPLCPNLACEPRRSSVFLPNFIQCSAALISRRASAGPLTAALPPPHSKSKTNARSPSAMAIVCWSVTSTAWSLSTKAANRWQPTFSTSRRTLFRQTMPRLSIPRPHFIDLK